MKRARHEGRARGDLQKQRTCEDNLDPACPQPFTRLDALARAECRVIWWRQLRLGNRLPPEPGVILIDGSINPNWPRPRTQRPEPESWRGGWS